ncbi:MAG: serine/threonine-protein kinase [Isosphaeraceae bacterium]
MAGSIRIGDWIGNRFQVFDIYEGGMSLVYVVSDHMGVDGRKVVALKTLRGDLLGSRIRVKRFAAECRLWAQLGEHPNIVRAHSVEVIDGRPYVLLELVQGGDLYRWIGTPKLDLPQVLRFAYQFCGGLEHALRQGLHCHRDVKPGNLLVTEEGTLKITDFGLARVCEEMVAVRPELPDGSIPLAEPTTRQPIIFTDPRDWTATTGSPAKGNGRTTAHAPAPTPAPPSRAVSGGRGRTNPAASSRHAGISRSTITAPPTTGEYVSPVETASPRLTRTGARLGTGAYMAPEQFRDPRSVDVRADIYSFGIVMFEMVTGRLPFRGQSIEELDDQHTVIPPASVVPAIPGRYAKFAAPVDALIQRCLKKEPVDRFHSVADLRRAVKQIAAAFPRR